MAIKKKVSPFLSEVVSCPLVQCHGVGVNIMLLEAQPEYALLQGFTLCCEGTEHPQNNQKWKDFSIFRGSFRIFTPAIILFRFLLTC